jgi:adenine deaminase
MHEMTRRYLDGIFGAGAGEKHARFLDGIENESLRETIHGYHALESDIAELSVAENYLLGMTVLCALKSYGTAGMFAKTLAHLGVRREKILAAVARLSMWTGGLQAVEASLQMQRALDDHKARGLASLETWFPR